MNAPSAIIAPALLLVGAPEKIKTHAQQLIAKAVVSDLHNESCSPCQLQHHFFWLCPEKKYTLEQFEPITQKICFELAPEEQFFFVIEKADFLTPATANSLLKLVEEPPRGYHFIFLAEQLQVMLPTIRSRCHVQHIGGRTSHPTTSAFLRHFTTLSPSPAAFLRDLQSDCPEDHETPLCVDMLLEHWSKEHLSRLRTDHHAETLKTKKLLSLFQEATSRLPMPGSAKLFWRDLFLRKGMI